MHFIFFFKGEGEEVGGGGGLKLVIVINILWVSVFSYFILGLPSRMLENFCSPDSQRSIPV